LKRSVALLAALAVAGSGLAPALAQGSAAEAGARLYAKHCDQCHGPKGDGAGHATGRVKPAPRDFTSGKYKFRTTPSGMVPTDDDLRRVIRQGLPYTSMPGWPAFTDEEVQDLIEHLKTFSADFSNPEKQAQPIDIPEPAPSSEDSIARGRTIYEEQGCAACHGELGRGDGLSAATLKDDWGHHIRPADMTQRWTFRGGPTRQDIFRTFSTGLNGTPMPSYFDAVAVEDRWHLVNYITSLGQSDEPQYSNLLVVAHLEDELDLSRGVELFASAPKARFPLVGQIMEPGRNFYPSTTSVEVQAAYNPQEIAFLVRWHDMRAETTGTNAPDLVVPVAEENAPQAAGAGQAGEDAAEGGDFWGEEAAPAEEPGDFWGEAQEEAGDEGGFWDEGGPSAAAGVPAGEFNDAVALQLPAELPSGIRKPYFIFGDVQSAVDLWFLDLGRAQVRQYTGRGSQSLAPGGSDEFEATASYDRGEWTVIFKRSLRSAQGISFAQGQFVPIAFSVWDGFNRERGNKRALSAWMYFTLEPAERTSAVLPMARAALGTLAVELLLLFWIRRRSSLRHAERTAPGAAGGVRA
jgi:cytochrome c